MTPEEVKKLPDGLYRIYWKEGYWPQRGTSLAAVGTFFDGNKWMAVTHLNCRPYYLKGNCIAGRCSNRWWRKVDKVELILSSEEGSSEGQPDGSETWTYQGTDEEGEG